MKNRHQRTLQAIFAHPVSANIAWLEVEALLVALGGVIYERRGSRVAITLFGETRTFHRPHPSPKTDKGAIADIKSWLLEHGITP